MQFTVIIPDDELTFAEMGLLRLTKLYAKPLDPEELDLDEDTQLSSEELEQIRNQKRDELINLLKDF